MASTYDTSLVADKDWVRLLSGDTNSASFLLSDEEIEALLDTQIVTGEAKRYYAAAEALDAISTRYANSGHGLVSKSVEHLSLEWGTDTGNREAICERIAWLRRRGARLWCRTKGRNPVARTVGNSRTRDVRR